MKPNPTKLESIEDIHTHVVQWRKDWIDNYNANFAGQSPFDQRVLIARIDGLEQDVKQLLCYIELLTKSSTPPDSTNN